MSFSSLPPELVHQIIESTVPHTFHSTSYNQRQQTLCSLSLVSKFFRSIAQPLLFEIVKLKLFGDATELSIARALGGGVALGVVRSLVIDWEYDNSERTQEEEERFAESLQVAETARNLTLSYIEEEKYLVCLLSMTSSRTHALLLCGSTPRLIFSSFSSDLTSLQLSNSPVEAKNIPRLPSLYNLTLHDVSSDLVIALLDPANVPNLRNFAFVTISHDLPDWLQEPSIRRFLLQLETLYLDGDLWLNLDASFRRFIASRTLVDVEHVGLEAACRPETLLVHARADGVPFSLDRFNLDNNFFTGKLDDYASLIGDCSSPTLKSFYLDSTYQKSSILPLLILSSLNNLARICQERKIDLVFEQIPVNVDVDPIISPEFVKRQRDVKGREQAMDGKGGHG
ncbi:hypothetical protein JCM5350_002320 [Sporobolomyces pararoseus]